MLPLPVWADLYDVVQKPRATLVLAVTTARAAPVASPSGRKGNSSDGRPRKRRNARAVLACGGRAGLAKVSFDVGGIVRHSVVALISQV